jgi:hypothetical protein
MARGRKKAATHEDIVNRLTAVKVMVRDIGGAMPTLRRELTREALESLDDVIGDLA